MRVSSGESRTKGKTQAGKGSHVKEAWTEEFMWTLFVGQSLNIPDATRFLFFLLVVSDEKCEEAPVKSVKNTTWPLMCGT